MKKITNYHFREFGAYLLIAVFTYAVLKKVLYFQQFEIDLFTSYLIPEFLINILSYGIPLMEFFAIVLLVFFSKNKFTAGYVFSVVVLLSIYLIVFEITKTEDCGCGRLFAELSFWPHLLLLN